MGNDVTILWVLSFFFVILGLVLPYFNAEFQSDYDGGLGTDISESSGSGITIGQTLLSMSSMFVWSTELPVILNVLFIPFRFAFFFLVARNIWIGGGA